MGMHTVVEGGKIPLITIDSLSMDSCSLIQLDVEGYELNVIAGAENTIKKFKPVIIGERTGSSQIISEFMADLGYKIADQSVSDTIWTPV
jgi:hypothetical protein